MPFDYVIVGAGSAGCVLANRLTEDPDVRVLMLEAGGRDRSLNIKIPAAFAKQFHTKLDWDFATEPEPAVDNRNLYIPRGRSLGGSSSMNAMLYVRGRPVDYDLWEAGGAAGWGWNDVLPYFLKSEDHADGPGEFHATGGPLRVSPERSPRAMTKRILDACEAHGIPWSPDYNGPEQDGLSMVEVTQKDGKRWSAADAFLHPVADRPNLEIRTGAQVLGLELQGDRVTGVRYVRRGRQHVERPEAEVILAAGAIQSPQLLQLSGIGRPDDLRAAGVSVRHALPGVGMNLQDHPFVVVSWEVSDPNTLYKADAPKHLAEWALRRTGPLTSSVAEAFAFVRTRPGLPAADVQFHVAPAFYEDHGAEEFDGHAAGMAPVLIAPQARGKVWLRSADPLAKPRIITNALEHPDDLRSLVDGVILSREIATESPLREVIVRELKPGPDAVDRADLEADIRRRLMLIYHPVGTCRMSDTGEDAVVDSQCRVHGLEGLRVVDASVFPIIPGGNTNAPTIMVAERAADLIRGRAPLGAPAMSAA